jgi:hypothetical protein
LARQHQAGAHKDLETLLYYDFLSLAGPLLPRSVPGWDLLFAKQHYGLPTRLLDWSTTFSVALYFALKPFMNQAVAAVVRDSQPSIWVLNPFELNNEMIETPNVLNPETDFDGSYQEVFIDQTKKVLGRVVAVNPSQMDRRLAAQRGCFTLHADLSASLDEMQTDTLVEFEIPLNAIDDGVDFCAWLE